ncbi:MAG: hypothetical protein ACK45G_11015, partial [Bacteroidota bacterium]
LMTIHFANFRLILFTNMHTHFTLLLLLFAGICLAQTTVPKTDIYLIPILNDKGVITYGDGFKLNTPGYYNNQPLFSTNSKSLYFSCISDSFKAEIFECELKKFEVTRFINAPGTAEYSLQYTPDLKNFSFVRVEGDDKTQTLYRYNPKSKESKALTAKDLQVGYYCWNNPQSLMLFLLRGEKEFELIRYPLDVGEIKIIDQKPGRCLWRNPQDGNIYYVRKNSAYTLMQYNPANELPGEFEKMPEGTEDFIITSSGDFMCGKEGKLLQLDITQGSWKEIADFSNKPYANFYRLAASPDGQWLALIVYQNEKP